MNDNSQYKLIFYIPIKDAERVKESIFSTGAGRLGNYSHCSWQTQGMGQFRALVGANPSIGEIGKLVTVAEFRIEILCTEHNIQAAIAALISSHPYEEPAYEVLNILNHTF